MANVLLVVVAAATVFAGVFNIDGQAAKVFEQDFGREAAVPAGA